MFFNRTIRSITAWNARLTVPIDARASVESLEGRTLLAAIAPDELTRSIYDHSLTPEQLESLGWADVSWQGQQIYAEAGEWIVGLERPQPTFDSNGELVDLNIKWSASDVPVPSLGTALDRIEGVTFEKYLGSEDIFLISAAPEMTVDDLQSALGSLDKFAHFSPNTILMGYLMPVDPQSPPEHGGDDAPTGGSGNDTANFSYSAINSPNLFNSSLDDTGNDYEYDGISATILYTDSVGSSFDIETLVGGGGHDRLTGSSLGNYLKGNGGSDTIYGMDGADTILGNSGNNRMYSDFNAAEDSFLDSVYGGDGTLERATVGSSPFDFVDANVETVIRL